MTKKVLIVVNPISGNRKKDKFLKNASDILTNNFNIEWLYWENKNQDIYNEVKTLLNNDDYYCVAAAGGDGTVNTVAKALVATNTPLSIIPFGSGNGLARHLKIPLNYTKALNLIASGKIVEIDSVNVNDQAFFCTSGLGFDAHIGHIFANLKRRGRFSYIKTVIKEFYNYLPYDYKIKIDDKEIVRKAFLVTVANAGQFGNNAWISPQANISDGLVDVTIIEPFSLFKAPFLAFRLFNKTINKCASVECFKARRIEIIGANENLLHYDGEPCIVQSKVNYTIGGKLRVIV